MASRTARTIDGRPEARRSWVLPASWLCRSLLIALVYFSCHAHPACSWQTLIASDIVTMSERYRIVRLMVSENG